MMTSPNVSPPGKATAFRRLASSTLHVHCRRQLCGLHTFSFQQSPGSLRLHTLTAITNLPNKHNQEREARTVVRGGCRLNLTPSQRLPKRVPHTKMSAPVTPHDSMGEGDGGE